MRNLNHVLPFFDGRSQRQMPRQVLSKALETPQTATYLKKVLQLPSILRGCLLAAIVVFSTTIIHAQCTAPVVSVVGKTLPLTGQTGTGFSKTKLLYRDIFRRITDSCDGDLTFNSTKVLMERVLPTDSAGPSVPRTLIPNATTTGTIGNAGLIDSTGNAATDGLTFTCMDVGTQLVRVWARNAAGNWSFAVSIVAIQDNDGICESTWWPGGTIATETAVPVKEVVVTASINGTVFRTATTLASGAFSLIGTSSSQTFQLRAAKTINTDRRIGVTTLDIALMSKHNLGIELLNSPYKIIAADVNKDGEVDASDMLLVRRFVLGIVSGFPSGSFWRFIDKMHRFSDPSRPFDAPFPEFINASRGSSLNFMAVKLGDVNNSFEATIIRGARELTLNVRDIDLVAGNTYTVPIDAATFDAATLQGTFVLAGATLKTITTGSLNNLSDNNFGLFPNAVTVSWNGKAAPSAHLLSITFTANKSDKLSNVLTFNSSITKAEASDPAGDLLAIALAFDHSQPTKNGFALYQNAPNPVKDATYIGFNLAKDGPATLTIYSIDGKVVRVIKNNYTAGYNTVLINSSDVKISGLFYYRLDTPDNSAVRRMVFVE